MRPHTKVRPGVGKAANKTYASIERLEDRRLLSDVSFSAPVLSPLPAGFQCQKLLCGSGLYDDYPQNLIATSSAGGGLWLQSDDTGSYTVKEQLTTSATILGFAQIFVTSLNSRGEPQQTGAAAVFTTAGIMLQQPNYTFAAPSGLAYPADAVPGAFAIGDFNSITYHTQPGLAVERFTPNPSAPGRGTLTIAIFPTHTDGTLGDEIDTTLTTDGVPDAGNQPLAVADFNRDGKLDIVADGSVWLGEGDGTFNTANPISLPVSSPNGNYVTADFNNDQIPDLAVIPASGFSSGTAQVLLNSQDGVFRTGGSATFSGAGTTDGTLIAADFTGDGTTDLASDVTSGSQAPAVSIAPNIGSATFFSPDVVPTPGFAAQLSVNFNQDSHPDLVGISWAGGQFSIVSLENQTASGPVIRLSVSPNPSVAGQPITATATTSDSQSSSGNLNFFDDGTSLGMSEVHNGISVFVFNSLSAGSHSLTANYGYVPNDYSNPVTLTVDAPPVSAPFLSPTQLSRKFDEWLVPGEKDSLRLDLSNLGGAAASTTLGIELYATTLGIIDSSAIAIPIPSLQSRAIHVKGRGKVILSGNYILPENIPAGTYYLAAKVTQIDGLLGSELPDSTIADTKPLTVAWQFGDVNGKKNVAIVQHLSDGQVVTFKLSGLGFGSINEGGGTVSLGSGNPDYQVTVQNTSSYDRLSISQTGSTASNIASLSIKSDLGICDVKSDTPHSISATDNPTLGFPADIKIARFFLGDIPVGIIGGSSAAGQITINDQLGLISAGALNGASVTLGSFSVKELVSIKIANMNGDSRVSVSSHGSSFQIGSAAAGSAISAPDIDKLNSQGDFDATVNVTGTTKGAQVLGQVNIGGSVIGTSTNPVRWAINGNSGRIRIGGDVENLQLFAGAQLGHAGELTSPPATYSGTDVQSFEVGGSVSSSLISAGLDPVDGVLLNGNDTLLNGGAIGSIFIKGLASNDSRFLASDLPTDAKIDSATVITEQDPRFALT